MKPVSFLLIGLLLAARAVAAPALEAGISYFNFNGSHYESTANVNRVDEANKGALFIGGAFGFTDQIGFRLSYHYVKGISATAELSNPPGSPLAVVVFGHYRDDVHLFSAGPEFKLPLNPTVSVSLTPQLNWVVSNGEVSYSASSPAVLALLIPKHGLNHDGLTLGAAARLNWAIARNLDLTLGYQFTDFDPSFDRVAHIISAGVALKF